MTGFRMLLFSAVAAVSSFTAMAVSGADDDVNGRNYQELIELEPVEVNELALVPKNIVRWHMGTRLYIEAEPEDEATPVEERERGRGVEFAPETIQQNLEAVIMGDDETLAYPMREGRYDLVFDFRDLRLVERILFYSPDEEGEGAFGKVTVRYSTDTDRRRALNRKYEWLPIEGGSATFGPGDRVDLRLDVVETRFLHVRFDITEPGGIAGFGVYSEIVIADTEFRPVKRTEEELAAANTIAFDYASLYAGSAITHISGGELQTVNRMIDDDIKTFYEMEIGPDDRLTMVLDLKQQYDASRISLIFSAPAGELEFYFLENLNPEESIEIEEVSAEHPLMRNLRRVPLALNLTGQVILANATPVRLVRFDEDYFEEREPVLRRPIEAGRQRLRHEFPMLSGQYLVMRFVPEEAETGGPDDNPDGGSLGTFKIYEVSVLHDIPVEDALLNYGLDSAFGQQNTAPFDPPTPIEPVPDITPVSPL